MKKVDEMLQGLEKFLKDGTFTPASHVDAETFVCFTEQTPNGLLYHQGIFEALQPPVQQLFVNRVRGERAGPFKIVAVFDFWMPSGLQLATAKLPN